MKLTVLDAETLGSDVSMGVFSSLGELTVYANTAPDEIVAHIGDAEVVLLNKIHLDEAVLKHLPCLRFLQTHQNIHLSPSYRMPNPHR